MQSLTTGSQPPEAFLLLSLSDATLRTPNGTQTGTLGLECVTITVRRDHASSDQAVYLVLRLGDFETPIDPARVIHRSSSTSGQQTYTFDGTDDEPSDLVITFPTPMPDSLLEEDLRTFDGILSQYADLRRSSPPNVTPASGAGSPPGPSSRPPMLPHNLKGQLVLVDEENGEVVGEVDSAIHIQEDPRLQERGREDDPVIIEVSEERTMGASELFALAVPSEEQDWMTKSASMISHAISSTTNLLLTTITSASSNYVSKSSPSVHNPTNADPNPSVSPPKPPRALVLLTSETTRKGLSGVHAVSGHAVNVSNKTVALIDRMIDRAVGAKSKRGLQYYANLSPANVPPRAPSPSYVSPPPYSRSPDTPGLPPRPVPSPTASVSSAVIPPPPIPPRSPSPQPPPLPARRLRTRDRIVLSADLILSTLEESAKQIVEVGGNNLSAVVGHKFGPAAAESSRHVTGTARNLVLIYIDVSGIGRKALLRKAGRKLVKAQLSSRK